MKFFTYFLYISIALCGLFTLFTYLMTLVDPGDKVTKENYTENMNRMAVRINKNNENKTVLVISTFS